MKIIDTLKKHKKAVAIGAGIAVLYIMSKRSSAAKPAEMPIGPTRDQLIASTTPAVRDHRLVVSGLGSL